MADAADDAPPPPPKQSGGFMGTLMNGAGIFVLTLVAVIVGGSINSKLHPLPDLQLDKDGKIKAIVPVAAAAHGEEGGAGKAAVYYAIDPPLVVNFEDGSVVRYYQTMMSREGKEKLRQEALTEIRAVQKKEGGPDVDDLLFTSFVVQ